MQSTGLYTYLTRSHDYLQELLDRLLDAMAADATDVRQLWNELDHGLRGHMETEERYVFPAFGRVDREEARALLRQHGHIREELFELGIAVDLHYIRYDRSKDFCDMLRRHAAREEKLLYRWADTNLDAAVLEAAKLRLATGTSRAA